MEEIKPKVNNQKKVRFSVAISSDMAEKVKDIANKELRSRNAIIYFAIKEYVERYLNNHDNDIMEEE